MCSMIGGGWGVDCSGCIVVIFGEKVCVVGKGRRVVVYCYAIIWGL